MLNREDHFEKPLVYLNTPIVDLNFNLNKLQSDVLNVNITLNNIVDKPPKPEK